MVSSVSGALAVADIVIDGDNTFYKTTSGARTRFNQRTSPISMSDFGRRLGTGARLLHWRNKDAVDRLDPIFRTLARGFGDIAHTPGGEGRDPSAEYGYIHAGPAGAGYFVKMIHNGIEYGLMQACAEGFGILRGKADTRLPESERFTLDVADIA
jgi:6-phosphogluconate dehydrogenase